VTVFSETIIATRHRRSIEHASPCSVWPRQQARRKERSITRKSGSEEGKSPSRLIDERIRELGDWRGKMLSELRTLIKQADPEVVEEWKWRGVPVWCHDGMICTGETHKNVVKMTFAKGATLETHQACSTPASMAPPGAPSTSTRARRLTRGP